ncbi:MAG: Gfo/Idh/MocA family oxidoreductase [Verrucomicrobia bacterium]|jgi:predicted dehydrogenase|nr:Gfo/Idh/MocA family oxidoreductase [Verrucomicrobiota bacterium]MBT7067758.1 Gfo/Idh/MocA family oxidoreductase [Verrucomicrobiota bacterium]MBT7702269.1 Gfo/Idh/MocA family oxidoreductase [Verrucomicrobiota bacterium]
MALKIGVVGMRGIGNNHAECHKKDDLAELVAVCDIVRERADEAAEKHGVKAYYSLKEMLAAHPDLDIVDVCTGGFENGSWHFEPTMEALDAGKHVLCEKPLSNQVDEARRMVARADELGLYLGCNLNHYFTQPADGADERLANGDVGQILYCLHRMGPPGGEFTYGGAPSDFRDKDAPYFHVKAFLAHPFSIMRHFCGDITHVQAFMDQPGYRSSAGDVMLSVNSIHVRFASGAVGYLLSQRGDSTFGLGGWWSVEVGGTRGSFVIENCVEKLSYYPAKGSENADALEKMAGFGSPAPIVTNSGVTDFGATFPTRIHAFLEDVTNQVPRASLRASGRDALATLEYTWAAIESYEQGGALMRPQPLPQLRAEPPVESK